MGNVVMDSSKADKTETRAPAGAGRDTSQQKTLTWYSEGTDLDAGNAGPSAQKVATFEHLNETRSDFPDGRDRDVTTVSGLLHTGDQDAGEGGLEGHRLVKDRFVVMDILGVGGMGQVFLVKDLLRVEMEDSSPFIAIKVLNQECRNLPGALQALQREAKKAQSLSHPNIVTVFDFDRDGDTAFITMEYIEGQSLREHLGKVRTMPAAEAMYVVERVARGLAYAHQQGFVHADIKPANIFLARDGSVKILDFGIAKAFTDAHWESPTVADDLTEGALTPAYASAQMLDREGALPSDDVYSMACMAYEMVAGHHPFPGPDGRATPANLARTQHRRVMTLPQLSRRHMKALRRGLAFDREQRFADAGEFIDAIKPRNLKKDARLLVSAALVTSILVAVVGKGLENMVPATSAFKSELAAVRELIDDADQLMVAGDLDMAHRFYAQAWELGNDLTRDDVKERKKAHLILADRLQNISDVLIRRSRQKELDEYQLREIYVALDFLQKDEIPGDEVKINRTLQDIDRRLSRLQGTQAF